MTKEEKEALKSMKRFVNCRQEMEAVSAREMQIILKLIERLEGNNITDKYINMLDAFSCDFSKDKLEDNLNCYGDIQFTFPVSKRLLNDIQLLQELSFNLRYNKVKIINVEVQDE